MIMMVAKTILMVTKTIKMMVDKTIKKQALCCRNVLAPLVSLIFRNYSVQCSQDHQEASVLLQKSVSQNFRIYSNTWPKSEKLRKYNSKTFSNFIITSNTANFYCRRKLQTNDKQRCHTTKLFTVCSKLIHYHYSTMLINLVIRKYHANHLSFPNQANLDHKSSIIKVSVKCDSSILHKQMQVTQL